LSDTSKITRPHGAVRGLAYVARSSTADTRFGPLFPGVGVADGPSTEFNATPPLLDTKFHDAEPGDENPSIPAGYTDFGQYIDHDLTFDPNSSLQKLNDPDATENFRTPRLDLDSLYGRGPDDPRHGHMDGRPGRQTGDGSETAIVGLQAQRRQSLYPGRVLRGGISLRPLDGASQLCFESTHRRQRSNTYVQ
jgi:hypothetical protein